MSTSIVLIWRHSEAKSFRHVLLFIFHGFISLVFGSPLCVIHELKKMIFIVFFLLFSVCIRSAVENIEIVL